MRRVCGVGGDGRSRHAFNASVCDMGQQGRDFNAHEPAFYTRGGANNARGLAVNARGLVFNARGPAFSASGLAFNARGLAFNARGFVNARGRVLGALWGIVKPFGVP